MSDTINSSSLPSHDEANTRALNRILNSDPLLVGVRPAIDVVPGMHARMLLHAGPPLIGTRNLPGPILGALVGALLFEGLAQDEEEAHLLIKEGDIDLSSTDRHDAVGPLAGVVSPSMPVFVVENHPASKSAFSTINEGMGRALRFGSYDGRVIAHLRWLRDVLAKVLDATLDVVGPLRLKTLITEGLHRGDECHNRNKATTAQFLGQVACAMVRTGLPREEIAQSLNYISQNDQFFLNLSIAHSKAVAQSADFEPNSTLVTAMSSNGIDFGIRIAGLGPRWITTDAPNTQTGSWRFLPGFGPDTASAFIGDSTISEVVGLGAFAMACAPAIAGYVGGDPSKLIDQARSMYKITIAEHPDYSIPWFNFRGVPVGIDIRKVIEHGLTPIYNGGVAGKDAGTGQVGAGVQSAPIACFQEALDRLLLESTKDVSLPSSGEESARPG